MAVGGSNVLCDVGRGRQISIIEGVKGGAEHIVFERDICVGRGTNRYILDDGRAIRDGLIVEERNVREMELER